jgi:hypothetical protein
MAIPDSALLLAGFVLAHGAWSVSDLPKGELLCPLAVIETNGNRTLSRFEAETQEVAIARGKSAMMDASKSADAWAFVREGLMPEGGVKVDVLVVDFWAKGMSAPVTIIQRFEPYSTNKKFKIMGEPKVVIDGVMQSTEKAKDLVQRIEQGISQHPKVKDLWKGWRSK